MPDPIAYLTVAKLSLWAIGNSGDSYQVGLTTLGQPRLSEGAQPYPMQRMTGPVIPTKRQRMRCHRIPTWVNE